MIVTIPYNPNLPGGYEKLTNALIRNGKHPNHTLVVIVRSDHEDPAFDFAMKIHEQFGKYVAVSVPEQPEPMFVTSNRMFIAALDLLRDYEPGDHEMPDVAMLYFDPTWRPTKTRWLDEFNTDYYLAGVPTTYGYFKDEKVIGPVVLKRDFLTKTKLLPFLAGSSTHWREFLAWEIINNGLQAEALGRRTPAYIRPADT